MNVITPPSPAQMDADHPTPTLPPPTPPLPHPSNTRRTVQEARISVKAREIIQQSVLASPTILHVHPHRPWSSRRGCACSRLFVVGIATHIVRSQGSEKPQKSKQKKHGNHAKCGNNRSNRQQGYNGYNRGWNH